MADPLQLLRDHLITKKKINQVDGLICFGDIGFPRQVATNFEICGKPGEFYTLEALHFFAQCCERELQHPHYVREAAKLNNLQFVKRPDRKSVQEYLTVRELERVPPSIASSRAPPVPVRLTRVQIASFDDRKRGPGDASTGQGAAPTVGDAVSGADPKRARLDAEPGAPPPMTGGEAVDDPMDGGKATAVETMASDSLERLRLTRQRERTWTNRNSMLMISAARTYAKQQSTSTAVKVPQVSSVVGGSVPQQQRSLYKTIVSTLHMIKQKHDASKQPRSASNAQARQLLANGLDPDTGMPIVNEEEPQAAGYSRYDQEKFRRDKTTAGFQIDQSTTFVGGTTDNGKFQPKASDGVKAAPTISHAIPKSEPPKGNRKLSRTPIIVIPASSTSLITMMNARALLEDFKYLTPQECRANGKQRLNEDKIERRIKGGTIVYRVVDNALKLSDEEWQRVVAVFAQGPLWQFKSWKLCLGEPVMLFQKICAFHLKYDDTKLDANIAKWAVHTLSLNKQQKHQHRATLMSFWSVLDKFVMANTRLKNTVKHP